jgi:hypothetical protein
MGRLMVLFLALGLVAAPAQAFATSDGTGDDVISRREEDAAELVSMEDDDDGSATGGDTGDTDDSGTGDSNDATGDSNDATGSGYSAVSNDRDLSRGDLTRDRTRDGAGGPKRDWSGGHTNDSSRNDTR